MLLLFATCEAKTGFVRFLPGECEGANQNRAWITNIHENDNSFFTWCFLWTDWLGLLLSSYPNSPLRQMSDW